MKLKSKTGWQKNSIQPQSPVVDHYKLVTSKVITEWVSIFSFIGCVGLLVGIALKGSSLFFSLVTLITQKSFKTLTWARRLLAQSKLDSMADMISHAM